MARPSSPATTASAVLSYCGIGTMAEATVVPEAAAIALPDGVDPAVAALIGCCVTTGVGAVLKTAAVPAGLERRGDRARWRRPVVRHGCRDRRRVADRRARSRVRRSSTRRVAVGATDGLLATDDRAATIEALRDLTDGGPDFVFEAIGRVDTVELAIEALPLGGHRGAGRAHAVRVAGVVWCLPARRRQPPDPRLQLRVRRSVRPTSRGTPPCTSPASCRPSA